MGKSWKCLLAVALTAAILIAMPGTASYAETQNVQTEDAAENSTEPAKTSVTEEPESDDTETPEAEAGSTDELGAEDTGTKEPEDGGEPKEEGEPEENPDSIEKEDTVECICGTLCAEGSINADCPVCGAEGAGTAGCKGEQEYTENPETKDTEENAEQEDTEENPEQEDTEEENAEPENTAQKDTQDTGLCPHHKQHTEECGYTEGIEDKEGTPCTYECRICPVEELIDALPDEVTEDNAEEVRAQLQEILALYRELTEEEQGQIDLSRCMELQEALDAASAPAPLENGTVSVTTSGGTVFYDDIATAWVAAQNAGSATLRVLQSVSLNGYLELKSGNVTLEMGDGVTLRGNRSTLIYVMGGTLTVKSGTMGTTGTTSRAVLVEMAGTLNVVGGTLRGLENHDGTVTFSGGTFENIDNGSNPVSDLLAPGYAYRKISDGKWVSWEEAEKIKLSSFVTVEKAPVQITKQPEDQTVAYGDQPTLSVTAVPENPAKAVTYAWYQDGIPISGATGSSYAPSGLDAAENGYEFYCVVECDGCTVKSETATVTVEPNPLVPTAVTLSEDSFTYNGSEQKPVVTVVLGGKTLTEGTDYTVAYSNTNGGTGNCVNAGTVTVTITGNGNYPGTIEKEFTIQKAEVTKADHLDCKLPASSGEVLYYTGTAKTAAVEVKAGINGMGTITVRYEKDGSSGYLEGEPIEPGTYQVYAIVEEGTNYKRAEIPVGEFTISYIDSPANLLYNGGTKEDYYNADVEVSATGYMVSDAIDGTYKDPYTIPAQEGTVEKTLYFKDINGYITDGVPVTVTFDLTPPTGEIAVGAKWWQNALHFISFGHYKAQDYTVAINAEDTGGSGIDSIDYAIVTGDTQYNNAGDLAAAGLGWTEYNSGSKPAMPVGSLCVAYARLMDNAGNITYISTEGILADEMPPAVEDLNIPEETRKDVTAGFTFTVSETADYYYVVLPKGSAAPSAEDIIVACGGTVPSGSDKTGTDIAGKVDSGRGAASADVLTVSAEAKDLLPNTEYTVYVTAVDRTWNLEDGMPAGNIGNVASVGFTTKKNLPVIMAAPAVSGLYGQAAGEMAVTGGIAKAGTTVLTGTWAVSGADSGKKPSVSTAEELTIIFTPDSESYDSVSVKVIPKVSPRSLTAPGVTITEVAGTYTYTGSEIKPPVEANAGTPAEGIYISDSGAALTGNDFTVSYSNNRNAGTATATITGTGNYTGTVTRTFTIEKAAGHTIGDLSGTPVVDEKAQTYTYTITPTEGAVYRMGESGQWTEPGQGTTPVKPGTGNTGKPGDAAGNPAAGTKQPFIKGADGKTGWDVIRAEEEKAEEGSVINVDMNGATVVPGNIFDSIRRRDITITFDMGNGILWSVDGKSVTTQKAGDIDFDLKTGVSTIPVDIINNVAGERYSIQINLSYEGEFGFTAVLSINLGRENAGYTASLYHYNKSKGELAFICADEIAEDGTAQLAFTHASDYVIAIDRDEEESGIMTEAAQPEIPDEDSAGVTEESSQTGQAWKPWRLIAVGVLVAIMGIGAFFVVKKKKEDEES